MKHLVSFKKAKTFRILEEHYIFWGCYNPYVYESPVCCRMCSFIHEQCEWEACTFPCMSSRSVRVTPKPPSPKSCSQFMVMWEWHAGRRMNRAHSLVTQSNEGQRSFSGSPMSFSAALREREKKNWIYSLVVLKKHMNQVVNICIHAHKYTIVCIQDEERNSFLFS